MKALRHTFAYRDVTVTGNDAATKRRMRDVQRHQAVTADGVGGDVTWRNRLFAVCAVMSLLVAACAAPSFEPAGPGTVPASTPPSSTAVEATAAPPTTQPAATTSTETPPPAGFSPTFLLDDVLASLGVVAVDPTGADPAQAAAVAGRTIWTDPEGGIQTKTFIATVDGSHRIETAGSRTELLVHDAATMTTEYWDPDLALVISGLPAAGPDGVDAFDSVFGLGPSFLGRLATSQGDPVTFRGMDAVKVVLSSSGSDEFDGPVGPTTVVYEAATGFPLLVERPDLTVETVALRFLDPADLDPAWFRLDLPDDVVTDRTQREWTRGTPDDLPPALEQVRVPGADLTDVFVATDGRVVASFRTGFHRVDATWIPDDVHRGLDPYNPDNPLPAPGTVISVTDEFGLRILDRRTDGVIVITGTDPDLVAATTP